MKKALVVLILIITLLQSTVRADTLRMVHLSGISKASIYFDYDLIRHYYPKATKQHVLTLMYGIARHYNATTIYILYGNITGRDDSEMGERGSISATMDLKKFLKQTDGMDFKDLDIQCFSTWNTSFFKSSAR